MILYGAEKIQNFAKKIMETISDGGLGLTNLKVFDASLTLSWLKRVQQQDRGWAEFTHAYDIQKIVLYGDIYADRKANNLENKFWADVLSGAWESLKLEPRNSTEFHNSPLWYNSHLNFQYRHDCANKGYRLIKYILDKNSNLMSLTELQGRNLKMNHLDYDTLEFNFRNAKQTSKISLKTYGPDIPYILAIIGIAAKGCANTYKRFFPQDNIIISEIQFKWSNILHVDEEILSDSIRMAFQNLRRLPIDAYTKYILLK